VSLNTTTPLVRVGFPVSSAVCPRHLPATLFAPDISSLTHTGGGEGYAAVPT